MCLLTRADTPCATQEPDKCWFFLTVHHPGSHGKALFILFPSILGLVFNTDLCFPQIITMDLHDPQSVYSLSHTRTCRHVCFRAFPFRCAVTRLGVPGECLVP
jgi:hypothetical protein